MSAYNEGFRTIADHAAICGTTAAIDLGRKIVQDWAEAVELGFSDNDDSHISFFLGVGAGVETIKKIQESGRGVA